MNYSPHTNLGYSKLFSDVSLFYKTSHRPNLVNFCPTYFTPRPRAGWVANFPGTTSSFLDHIFHVVLLGSKPKMIWVHTKRIVTVWAVVKNERGFVWNFTSAKNPTRSVCQYWSRFVFGTNQPISLVVPVGCPKPTRSRLGDFTPKPFWKCWGQSLRRKIFRGNFWRHIKSSFFGLLAPWQLQLPGAPFNFSQEDRYVNA